MVCVSGRGVNRGEGYPSELCLETSSAADTIDESNDQGEQSFPLRINSATNTRTSKCSEGHAYLLISNSAFLSLGKTGAMVKVLN